jgi:Protein of unknown function (DUF1554)
MQFVTGGPASGAKTFFLDNPPDDRPAAAVKSIGKNLPFLLAAVFLVYCAPKPSTETVDLSKTRASLMLTDGSPISSDVFDDRNPILVRLPDEHLVLVFESNRSCDEGCNGNYNLFIAESEEPYYGDYIPAFLPPQVLHMSNVAHNLSATPFNFQATFAQDSLAVVLQHGGLIKFFSIPKMAISAGDTGGPPAPIPNPNRRTDTLIHLDTRTFQITSRDSSRKVYLSRVNLTSDSGTQIYNEELLDATNAARVVPAISGFTDTLVYEYFGYLAFGHHDEIGDYMETFNEALDRENLEISYVSVMHMFLPETELLLFSAGEPGEQHDLYAVDSHTLDDLWYQEAYLGAEYEYSNDFSIFQTDFLAGFDGDLRTAGQGTSGIEGADNLCNNDSMQPNINLYYKAMIVDSTGERTACTSANCSSFGTDEHEDWVIQPFAKYFQAMGTFLIDTADDNGLLAFSTAPGSFPMTWTGLATDWTTDVSHCSDWTSNAVINGTIGNGSMTGTDAYSSGVAGCDTAGPVLYCVEQPSY